MGKGRSQETGDRRQEKWELSGRYKGKLRNNFSAIIILFILTFSAFSTKKV
ncbi:MAG: hypothetical protein AB4080_09490 [Trichodesmium sp.]